MRDTALSDHLVTAPLAPAPPARRGLDVGVDLDGCCYDFASDLRDWLVAEWGLERERLVEPTCWAFFTEQWGLTEDEFAAAYRSGVAAGALFRGGIDAEAAEALGRLAGSGHRVHVLTARAAYGAGSEAVRLTEDWVRRWALPVCSVTVTDGPKAPAATRLGLDVAIDDSVANYAELEAAGVRPYLLDRAWNRGHPGRRAADWACFVRAVDEVAVGLDFELWGA